MMPIDLHPRDQDVSFTPSIVTLVQYPNGGWVIQLGRLGADMVLGPDGMRPAQVGAYSDSVAMLEALAEMVYKSDRPLHSVDDSATLTNESMASALRELIKAYSVLAASVVHGDFDADKSPVVIAARRALGDAV